MTKRELQKIKRRGVKQSDIPNLVNEIESLQEAILNIFALCVGKDTFYTADEVISLIETHPVVIELAEESIGGYCNEF